MCDRIQNTWPELLKSAGLPVTCSVDFYMHNNNLGMIVRDGKQVHVGKRTRPVLRALIAKTYFGGKLSSIPDGKLSVIFFNGEPGKLLTKHQRGAMEHNFGEEAYQLTCSV